jgi:hypothetical protein
MTTNARIGLIVGIGAGVVFLLCLGGVVGLVVWKDRGERSGVEKTAETLKARNARYTDPDAIRSHKWWQQPLTGDQLEKIVAAVISTNKGGTLCIDRSGRIVDPSELAANAQYLTIKADGTKRPDRTEVLISIAVELDAAEFENGPGR